MALTTSKILPLGTLAPDFSLVNTSGQMVSKNDFKDANALLVIFMCNHCPFVKHVLDKLTELIKDYQEKDVAVVGINSNDISNYPDDGPELMTELSKQKGFTFDYLFDETQEVAKAYNAACTPDFFLFDKERKLVYHGQFDDSRSGNDIQVTGKDLTAAIDAVIEGREISSTQKPSIGCSIKWK